MSSFFGHLPETGDQASPLAKHCIADQGPFSSLSELCTISLTLTIFGCVILLWSSIMLSGTLMSEEQNSTSAVACARLCQICIPICAPPDFGFQISQGTWRLKRSPLGLQSVTQPVLSVLVQHIGSARAGRNSKSAATCRVPAIKGLLPHCE